MDYNVYRFGYRRFHSTELKIAEIENVLQTYSLEEIIEQNDLSEADVLLYLVEEEVLQLPDPEPLNFDD